MSGAPVPRPCLQRAVARQTGAILGPPTEAEKQDAILVLRDVDETWTSPMEVATFYAAQEILDEAGR